MSRNPQMAAHDLDEGGIAFGGPDGCGMADGPEQQARDPQTQSESKSRGKGPIHDGDRARRSPHQDRFGQRTAHWRDEPCNWLVHQITMPPPKEKNDRKKLEAAKAIESPNTI